MAFDPWWNLLPPRSGSSIIRVGASTWASVTSDVFDFTVRENAGVLFVRAVPTTRGPLLTGLRWFPVPDEYVLDSSHGLAYDGRFHLRIAEIADDLDAGAVLIHAHAGTGVPRPSRTDAERGAAFLAFMRRRRPDATHGLVVVADGTVTGVIDEPSGLREVEKVVSCGLPTQEWIHEPASTEAQEENDRQLLAIGAEAQCRLARSTVAVVGNSGGGSHVTQQLIHAGVGTLIVIDPDIVTPTNLRRLVGAIAADVDSTEKVEIARRTAAAVRPSVQVESLVESFPSTDTVTALRGADLIIGCVDGWDTRDDLNAFALTSRIPYIDIGIAVAPPTDHLGMRVGGQIAIVVPDQPCLRCIKLVTDARVEASRERRQGYASEVPEPQVVSFNGTVASEAVTAALMLIAGDDRLVPYRRYAYPPGKLIEVDVSRDPACPACRAAHLLLGN